MTLGEVFSVVILIISALLFLLHVYLVFFQNKLQKAIQNKKESTAQKEAQEAQLQALLKLIAQDKALAQRVNQELAPLEHVTSSTVGFTNKL